METVFDHMIVWHVGEKATHKITSNTHTYTLTKTIVPIMRQAKAVVARAPVISRDVDALVDAAAIVFSCTLVDICRKMTTWMCFRNVAITNQLIFKVWPRLKKRFNISEVQKCLLLLRVTLAEWHDFNICAFTVNIQPGSGELSVQPGKLETFGQTRSKLIKSTPFF